MNPMGSITSTKDGGYVLTHERTLARSPAQIWAALTDPQILARWLAHSEVDLRVGGKFVIFFFDGRETMSGVIQVLEHERLIEYTWVEDNSPQSRVRWTIASEGEASLLTLTHTLPAGTDPAVVIELGGGWHAILGHLDGALRGEQANHDAARLQALEKQYGDVFRQAGGA